MNHLADIQISALLASLVVYGLLAAWFVAPWLKRLNRADALITLLMVSLPLLVWQLYVRRSEPLAR